ALCLTWGIALSALVYPLFSALILIWWLSEAAWLLTSQKERIIFSCVVVVSAFGVVSILVPACIALHRRRLWRLLPWLPLLPLYYGLVSIAGWGGVWCVANVHLRPHKHHQAPI